MILRGADIVDQDSVDSQAYLSIAQAIVFNCKKTAKKSSPAFKSHHSMEYEPPLPPYTGLKVNILTRSKKLVMELNALGLSVSYDRVLEVENELTRAVCQNPEKKAIVVPAHNWCSQQCRP